ncbi:MAG: hypothetical protein GY951_15515 [Psychromonas sp.]|nr:hypothetical protein [Alteromonadales bacterium]MCP5079451.1 hypothetical protein [Psychromonas sp.]
MKNKHGFVLISVLLITTISSVLALNAVKEGQLQERIGGNQQKELNARLKAEEGVFASFAYIKDSYSAGVKPVVEDIKQGLREQFNVADNIQITVVGENAGIYSIISQGTHQGAVAHLKANILSSAKAVDPEPSEPVVGCDGVVVKGSGHIDSFNSEDGAYNELLTDAGGNQLLDENLNPIRNKSANASVSTVTDNADINLSGTAPILGDVNATGNFSMNGSSSVQGNINANHNITFASVDSDSQFAKAVTGDVAAGGDFNANGNSVTGNASVVGIASNTNDVEGMLSYGMNGSMSGEAASQATKNQQLDSVSSPNVTIGDCDNKGLSSEFSQYSSLSSEGDFASNSTVGTVFEFTKDNAQRWNVDNGQMDSLGAVDLALVGDEKLRPAHVFDEFTLNGRDMTVKGGGEVIIVVKGDFLLGAAGVEGTKQKGESADDTFEIGSQGYLADDNDNRVDSEGYRIDINGDYVPRAATINVEDDTTLILIVAGTMSTKTGTQVKHVASTTTGNSPSKGRSPLEIYSAHASTDVAGSSDGEFGDLAVDIQSTDMAASIYAPLGHVAVKASGQFMGKARGKTVLVSGAGGLHYDESLVGEGAPPPSGDRSQYTNVYYYYPNN